MLNSILGTNCDVDRLVPWLRRGPVRVPLFFPKLGFPWSKMCTGQPSFVYLSAFTFLSAVFTDFFASHLFSFLNEAGAFVGSSIVVPLVFPWLFFVFTMFIRFFAFVFSFSRLLLLFLLLHLLRVHSC